VRLQLEDESTAVSMKNPVETRSLIVAEFYTNGIGNSNVHETQRLTEMIHALIIYELQQRLLEQVSSLDAKNIECVDASLGDGQVRFS
jgi:flagellar basal body rod protein FlgG